MASPWEAMLSQGESLCVCFCSRCKATGFIGATTRDIISSNLQRRVLLRAQLGPRDNKILSRLAEKNHRLRAQARNRLEEVAGAGLLDIGDPLIGAVVADQRQRNPIVHVAVGPGLYAFVRDDRAGLARRSGVRILQ